MGILKVQSFHDILSLTILLKHCTVHNPVELGTMLQVIPAILLFVSSYHVYAQNVHHKMLSDTWVNDVSKCALFSHSSYALY